MSSSRRSRRLQRHARMRGKTTHLNIVSLIDVFAVLVFFLLVSSSISAARLNIISLNLPSPDQTAPPPEQDKVPLQLTITMRSSGITVSDSRGVLKRIANTTSGYDIDALSELLVQVKRTAPEEKSVTLLFEPEIPYDNVIQVMDATRLAPLALAGDMQRELFPQISIGDAAVLAGAAP